MIKRIYSSLLALVMVVGLLPATAFAAVTSTNDWDIFDAEDTYNLPKTQEQLLAAMIRDPVFANAWAPIVNNILPETFVNDNEWESHNEPYVQFTANDYANVKYTSKGLRDAVTSCIDESQIKNDTGILNSLPEAETPVYYVCTKAERENNFNDSFMSTGYGYYIQLFYDFEIEGIKRRFISPSVENGDTAEKLEEKGYQFSLGGSDGSYKVTAKNRNDFENTVEKSYTYEKSTSTSTTVSNTYSQNWTEATTIGVEFSIPILAAFSPNAKVEQSFSYSYGMEKTYETSKEESYSQSITDTISVPLPAHTGIDINVDVKDMKTTIPYAGAVRIKYKTMILSASGCHATKYHFLNRDVWWKMTNQKYTFGRGGLSAIEDLDARIENRNVEGYDPDKLDMKNLYENNTAFSGAADTLRSGHPVAPYFGDFHYTSKNTIITPQQVYPIYALDRLVPDTEKITLYEQQDMRLDSIKVQALNKYGVAWYGFNPRLSGKWTVVDENLDDASEYAEIGENRNGYPILKALKPNDGKELFLRYEPKSSIEITDDFRSELIELTINPVKLSSVTVEGSFDTFYLNDGNNKTDVSGLTVTAKDEDGNDFDVTNKVKWYAEEKNGITVNETTGKISFDKAGTYQIYAVVNGTESNRVALQVLPERYLNEITVEGTIPDLTYDDDTTNTFDLSSLTITGVDQYGHTFTLDTDKYDWRLTSDKDYAAINGNTITGLVVGMDTVTLYYPAGKDDNNETVYKQSLPITVKVVAKPYVDEFYYNGGAPNAVEGMAYDLTQIPLMARDQHGNPFDVPNDIKWKLADNNETVATIENGMLTVEVGQVPNASYADVILEADSPSLNKTARNIVVKAEQQPVLKSITATMNESFILRLDENAKLADHFSAVGYDQYGREMQGVAFTWHTSKPDVVSLGNGTLKALKEDSTEIYATAEGIESNRITLTVAAPRRLTGISVSGVSSTAAKNTTFDLTKAVVKTVDQFGKEFNSDELAAYPASIRWTLEKNDTNAVIDGNTLSFGDKDGKMTLICAAVNADTNVIVDKRIDIQIGGSSSGGGGGGGGGGGTAKSAYMITVENTKNGEVVSSHKTADKGDTVTLTATPDKGYAVRRIIVTDSSDQKLTLTEKDGKYTFTMPSSNVTVKTTFIMDKSKDEVPNPFEDVSANSYYYDAVQWAVKNGTTGGTSATTFSPDASCTRAQAVTFLWRAAGSPAPSSTEMPFADVPADAYYRNAVLWAVENGITGGTSATTFSPDAPCSRGQIVAFLWRSKQSPMVAAENPFMDVNAADYYHDAVLWAAENGITGGTGANTFSPDAPCTRAQIVTFLYRALHK